VGAEVVVVVLVVMGDIRRVIMELTKGKGRGRDKAMDGILM
jgi:hypothetical protein